MRIDILYLNVQNILIAPKQITVMNCLSILSSYLVHIRYDSIDIMQALNTTRKGKRE